MGTEAGVLALAGAGSPPAPSLDVAGPMYRGILGPVHRPRRSHRRRPPRRASLIMHDNTRGVGLASLTEVVVRIGRRVARALSWPSARSTYSWGTSTGLLTWGGSLGGSGTSTKGALVAPLVASYRARPPAQDGSGWLFRRAAERRGLLPQTANNSGGQTMSDLPIQCLRRRVLGEAQHVASAEAGQAPRPGDEKKPQVRRLRNT